MESETAPENPARAEFESWRSYWNFRKEVARDWRYVRSPKAQRFLEALIVGSHSRVTELVAGRPFYRAQVAHHDELDEEVGATIPAPALPGRMIPFRDRATEGRVNPKGIPCLYLASDEHTAMAEYRPGIGALISVGVFRTSRALKVVDCTRSAEQNPLFIEGEPSAAKREEAVWAHVARAFREPITRDDNIADYAPTQVIAETFRAEGFDGVAYRSAFGTDRFNVALFDLNAATLVMCSLHEIRDVELKYKQTANPYYVRSDADGSVTLVRNVIVGFRAVDDEDGRKKRKSRSKRRSGSRAAKKPPGRGS